MLDRITKRMTVSVTTDIATTEEIPYGIYGGGSIHIPDGSSITSITWSSAPEKGDTYEAAYDKDGLAVTQTVAANGAYPIPLALFGAGAIKAVGNAAGTIYVSRKT